MSTIKTISKDIFNLLPEGVSGEVKIVKNIKQTFIELFIAGVPWMNNLVAEDDSHLKLYDQANGDVLLVGLGLGCDILLLQDKPEVTSIEVIENNPEVIALVSPFFTNPKVKIIEANIYTWIPTKRYTTIWFDILRDDVDLFPTDKTAMQLASNSLVNVGSKVLFWTHPKVISGDII